MAAQFCKSNVLRLLLGKQEKVNAQNGDGETALHIGARHSDWATLKILVSNGADLNILNDDSRTPLMVAFQKLNHKAVEALLKLGSRVNFQSSNETWTNDLKKEMSRNLIVRNLISRIYPNDPDFNAFMKCMGALLGAGWSLHEADPFNMNLFFRTCIREGKDTNIKLLMQSGAGPFLLSKCFLPRDFFPSTMMEDICTVMEGNRFYISPLCAAMMFWRTTIVSLFAQACFYHPSDLKLLQQPDIQKLLKNMFHDWPQECKQPSPLKDLCPANWSLRTWSKLAVLKAVGVGEGKEDRVRALPIPRKMQDELLYKHISVVDDLIVVIIDTFYSD